MVSRISRRGLLSTALSLAALRAAHADPVPVETASDADHILAIPVMVSGQGPFHFVVDSGAERTVLAEDVAARLGLDKSGRASVIGIARELPADTVRLDHLQTGSVEATGLDVPVLPRAFLEGDGYLGLDVIDRHRITFDFAHRRLELREPVPSYFASYIHPDEDVLHTNGDAGKLRTTDCRVDGIFATAFLDTGADVSVGNTKLYDLLSEQGNHFLPTAPVMLSGITGGHVPARTLSIGRVQLGNLDLDAVALAIADLPIFTLWNLESRPALFLGMDVLSQFSAVTIDYGRRQYRLKFASLKLAGRTQTRT